jgi:hypothetical protein
MGNKVGKGAARDVAEAMNQMGGVLARSLGIEVNKCIEFVKVFCLPRVDDFNQGVNNLGVEAVREVDEKIKEMIKKKTLLNFYKELSPEIGLTFGEITENIMERAISTIESNPQIPALISSIFENTIHCFAETAKEESIEVVDYISKLIEKGSPEAEALLVRVLEKNTALFEKLLDKADDNLNKILKITLKESESLLDRVIEKTLETGGDKIEKVLLKVIANNIHLIEKVYGRSMKTTVDTVDNKVSHQIDSMQKWLERVAALALQEGSNEAKKIILFSLENGGREVSKTFDKALISINPYFKEHLQQIEEWMVLNRDEAFEKLSEEIRYLCKKSEELLQNMSREGSKLVFEGFIHLKHLIKSFSNEFEFKGPIKNFVTRTFSSEDEKAFNFIKNISMRIFRLFIEKSSKRDGESIHEMVDKTFETFDNVYKIKKKNHKFDCNNIYFSIIDQKLLNCFIIKALSDGLNFPDLNSLEIKQTEENFMNRIADRIYTRLTDSQSPLYFVEHTDLENISDKDEMEFCLFNGEESSKILMTSTDSLSEIQKTNQSKNKEQTVLKDNEKGNSSFFGSVNKVAGTIVNGLKNTNTILEKFADEDTVSKILNKSLTGGGENKKKEIYELKDKKTILNEIKNKQSRVILFYKQSNEDSTKKERMCEYFIFDKEKMSEEESSLLKEEVELQKNEKAQKLSNLGYKLYGIIHEELKEISRLVSEESNHSTRLSLLKKESAQNIKNKLPDYQQAFNHFYQMMERASGFLNKHRIKKESLKDEKKSLKEFLTENKLIKEFQELFDPHITKIEPNNDISNFSIDRFGPIENQFISQYDMDLPDTIIKQVHVEINSFNESNPYNLDNNPDTCLLLQHLVKTFILKYRPREDSTLKNIPINKVSGLGDCLGNLRDVDNFDTEKKDRAKKLISGYINDTYHYQDFFLASEKAYNEKHTFNLCKIGIHLEKITDRDNEDHLYGTGKTFFRMRCYEKALFYFTLALEKYSFLFKKNRQSTYYAYQVNLIRFFTEKLKLRKEEDLLDEETLLNDKNYPKKLSFSLIENKVLLEDLEKISHITSVSLEGIDWTDEHLKTLIEALIKFEYPVNTFEMQGSSSISDEGLKILLKLKLESLNLSHCSQLTPTGFKILSKMEQLSYLNLSNCSQLVDTDLENIEELTDLARLNLSNCNQLTTLKSLKNLDKLIYLNIYGCSELKSKDFESWSLSDQLNFLVLPLCWQWNEQNIKTLSAFLDLTYLNINNEDALCKDSLESLFESLKKITHLGLNCKKLDITDLTFLNPLKLLTLNLINSEKLTSLEGLNSQSNLTSLNLEGYLDSNNELPKMIENLKNLKTYQLNGNPKINYQKNYTDF